MADPQRVTCSAEQRSSRLHGFDAVRGLAALAVVVLHAAYPYIVAPMPGLVWTVPVDDPSPLADAVFWWIEGCIMPVFFTLSGYFLARSLARQTPRQFIAGRTRRLVLPMLTIGVLVLTVDLLVWGYGLIATGRATFRQFVGFDYDPAIQENMWGPAHMWYVEYLWLMCLAIGGATAVFDRFGKRLAASDRNEPRVTLPLAAARPFVKAGLFAALATGVTVILIRHPEIVLGFQHGFLPSPPKLFHSAMFLLAGILLGQSPRLVNGIRSQAAPLLCVAVGTFAVLLPRIESTMLDNRAGEADVTLGMLLTLFAFSATLGQIGAGLRWLDKPNPWLSRLAAASFWLYLVHHPIQGLLQVVLRPVAIPPLVKFAIVLAVTLPVCLVAYRLFVAHRGLGRLLDGEHPWRAFRRAEPAIVKLPERERLRRAA